MAKAYKIPKRIAGLRIPRSIRKSTILGNFLQNPSNRQLATNMAMAAAGAIATVLAQHRPNAEQVKHAAHNVGEAGSSAAGAVTEAVTRVARSLASTLVPSDDTKISSDIKKRDIYKKKEELPDIGEEKAH
jgi:hypothetical protein